ncbi:MAG: DUF393 domain-containing protein [Gammaproteobacteria bacterium]|nr:DUF393 domain-containing protein [Gammaproteobacteria bacterium]
MPETNDTTLLYDRQCPVCTYYASKIDVAEGNLVRVNARETSELLDAVTRAGLDIDQGMALKVGETIHFGSDAIHQLALRSSGEGFFNGLMARLFRRPRIAKAIYPLLVACRNLLLKLLGRSRINNLGTADKERF